MTPEGFLFTFFATILGICIATVVVVASTIAATVSAITVEEDASEE